GTSRSRTAPAGRWDGRSGSSSGRRWCSCATASWSSNSPDQAPPRFARDWRPSRALPSRGQENDPRRPTSRPVVVDILDLQRMLLDKFAAGLDLLAHQDAEHLIHLEGVVELHLEERTLLGVERRLPQFLAVHLAQALEAHDRQAALAELANL